MDNNFLYAEEVEIILNNIIQYDKTKNKRYLRAIQHYISIIKDIDYGFKTHEEYNEKVDFIETSHGPARYCILLLNNFAENYLDGGTLKIYQDDRKNAKINHTNTYKLALKDAETHHKFYKGNPTGDDEPYDFKTEFVAQETLYNNGKKDDTTRHAWDSFCNEYKKPFRKLDFKSALWNVIDGKNAHFVDYILKLDFDENLKLYYYSTREEKIFEFIPSSEDKAIFLHKYYKLLNNRDIFNLYTWDSLILEENK